MCGTGERDDGDASMGMDGDAGKATLGPVPPVTVLAEVERALGPPGPPPPWGFWGVDGMGGKCGDKSALGTRDVRRWTIDVELHFSAQDSFRRDPGA